MDKPKVGEVWISSVDTEHNIVYSSNDVILSQRIGGDGHHYIWKDYNGKWGLHSESAYLHHKKPITITRYLGYFTDEDSIDGYVTKLSFVETPSYKQKIEIEINN